MKSLMNLTEAHKAEAEWGLGSSWTVCSDVWLLVRLKGTRELQSVLFHVFRPVGGSNTDGTRLFERKECSDSDPAGARFEDVIACLISPCRNLGD